MSAPPPGPPGTTPNGTAPRPRRKPKDTAALVQRRPAARKQASLAQRPGPAGLQAPPRPTATNGPAPISRPTAGPATFAERPRSPSPSMEPTILAVFATKRALLEGLRFHVARLQSKESVDVTNESQFTRPIRLHRRDPRIQPGGGDGMDLDSKDDLLDEKERERVEAAKLERQRIREENAKLIAPAAPSKKKPQAFKKKVEQVYRTDDNPEDRKRSQLRYEEALPWHLEDFDNKHIWQGSYEAALSECHVMLMHNPAQDGTRDAHLRLVPMEKWYRFREKNKVKYKAPEDVETLMNKKVKEPAFLIKHEQQEKIKKMYALDANKTRGLFQRAGGREEAEAKEAGDVFGAGLDTPADADDIDFNLDEEFADDEENPIFEGDDDTQKQAEERIKRDQLGANVFGMTDEQEVDEEAEREKKLAEMRKQLEKGTRKALLKREKNYD
jgi:transcription initiation factor TFIIF subunit alpha